MKTYTITKRDGEAEWSQDPGLIADLLANGTYDVSITRQRGGFSSTKAQQRLLWMWLGCVQQQTGDKTVDLYKYYCLRFLSYDASLFKDCGYVVAHLTRTTGELTKEEMTAFLDKVREDVRQRLGIRLPIPEDRAFEQFNQIYG